MRANDGVYAETSDLYGSNERTFTTEPRVTLMVVEPSFTPTQVARPLVFDASDQFLEDFKQTLSDTTAGGTSSYVAPSIVAGMYNSQSAFTAVAPSSQGYLTNNIAGMPFDGLWRFILIVDNAFVDNTGRAHSFSMHAKGRHVFTGYFLQEPVSVTNYGQGYAVNENAQAVVTSHVRLADIGKMDVFNKEGGISVSATNNIVHGSQYRNAYGRNDFCFTTPSEVMSASAVETFGGGVSVFSSPSDSSIVPTSGTTGDKATALESSLSAPRDYLYKMTRGFIAGTNEVAVGGGLGQRFDVGHTADDSEVLFSTIAGNFQSASHGSMIYSPGHIDTNWSISQMMSKYPFMQIYPVFIANRSQTFSVANETSRGMISVLSSYISDTIPTLMWENNISIVQFRFRSGLSRSERDGVYDPYGLGGLLQPKTVRHFADPGQEAASRNLTMFFAEFKRSIVDPIRATFGDFDVMISAGVGGDCTCALALTDYGERTDGFHVDSLAFGLTNPLVAGQDVFTHNAVEMGKCVQAAQEVVGDCVYNLDESFNRTFG